MNKNKFNFFVPISFEKAGDTEAPMKIRGICSSEVEDADGEILEPSGFDFAPLLSTGFFNYNHRGNKDPGAIIGEPTHASVINSGKDLSIEGFLYPNAQGKATWELGNTLQNFSSKRRLGWSIEGQVIERDPMNPKRIKRARITGVAITPCPKNPNTFVDILKGDYQEAFVDSDVDLEQMSFDLEVEKAMGTNVDINPESIESKKRPTKKSNRILKKSDVYEKIITNYSCDFEKAEKIYTFIVTVNDKLFKMTNNNQENQDAITEDVLEKAFSLLEEASTIEGDNSRSNLSKGKDDDADDDDADDDDNDDDNDDINNVIKAKCQTMIKAGESKVNTISRLIKSGVSKEKAEFVYQSCIAESNANKDGGNISKLQPSTDIVKSIDEGLKSIQSNIDKKFQAIGVLLKKSEEDNTILKENLDTLQKSYDTLSESYEGLSQTLEQAKSAPIGRKSITSATAIERFEKSDNGTATRRYNINNSRDVAALSNQLYIETEKQRKEGFPNERLEKAVSDLEISKTTNYNSIFTDLQRLGITLVGEGA